MTAKKRGHPPLVLDKKTRKQIKELADIIGNDVAQASCPALRPSTSSSSKAVTFVKAARTLGLGVDLLTTF